MFDEIAFVIPVLFALLAAVGLPLLGVLTEASPTGRIAGR